MAHLIIGSRVLLWFCFCSSLYNLDINLCSKVQLAKIFSHSSGCLLIFLTSYFAMELQLNPICQFLGLFPVQLEYSTQKISAYNQVLKCFSSNSFSAFGFKVKSLTQFELMFVKGGKHESNFLQQVPIIDTSIIWWSGVIIFQWMCLTHLSKIMSLELCKSISLSSLSTDLLLCLSILTGLFFFITVALQYSLSSSNMMFSSMFSLFRIALEVGGVAQWLKALTAFPGNPSMIPSTHKKASNCL